MVKGNKPKRPAIDKQTKAAIQAAKDRVKETKVLVKKANALGADAIKAQRAKLKKQGSDIREFRGAVSALKKAGVLSKRVDARRQEPTNYMLSKLRQFAGVINKSEQAIPIPKDVRERYKESDAVKLRGRFALVPREDKEQVARIRKGHIEITTPMGRANAKGKRPAYMREVILPHKMTSMQKVAESLANDPTLAGLKEDGELFGARIFGHNISQGLGYPDAAELGDYILRNYQHLMSQANDGKSVKYFRLFKFWNNSSFLPEASEAEKDYQTDFRKKRVNKKGRNSGQTNSYEELKRKRRAAKRAAAREKETIPQREKRLKAQRERQANLRSQKGYERPD